jgi:hypothetical protein
VCGGSQVTDSKARVALEQRRAGLLKGQDDVARAAKERKLAVRYHKVKFFGARASCAPAALPRAWLNALPCPPRAQEGGQAADQAARGD